MTLTHQSSTAMTSLEYSLSIRQCGDYPTFLSGSNSMSIFELMDTQRDDFFMHACLSLENILMDISNYTVDFCKLQPIPKFGTRDEMVKAIWLAAIATVRKMESQEIPTLKECFLWKCLVCSFYAIADKDISSAHIGADIDVTTIGDFETVCNLMARLRENIDGKNPRSLPEDLTAPILIMLESVDLVKGRAHALSRVSSVHVQASGIRFVTKDA